jgi:hypothetical protein
LFGAKRRNILKQRHSRARRERPKKARKAAGGIDEKEDLK